MLPITVRKPQFSATQPTATQSVSERPRERHVESRDIGAYPVDIWEDQMSIVVEAELPGFSGNDVDVILGEDYLQLQADRTPQKPAGRSHLSERQFVTIQRKFNLPCPVDGSRADASLKNGVLRLQLPKADTTQSAVIRVGQGQV